MRADMKKVLTERPRHGGRYSYHDVRVRSKQSDPDNLPSHEGMRRPHRDWKEFSDLIGPLRRFLRSCVGRRWDDVYSEICKVVGSGNTVDQHLRQHVAWEISTNVHFVGGVPMAEGSWGGFRTVRGLYVDRRGIIRYYEPKRI